MKKLILIAACFFLSLQSFSAVITAVTNNGDWTNVSTWNPARVPADNDIILIPPGKTVLITSVLSYNFLTIDVYGTLKLTGGKISVATPSVIFVFTGGKIKGGGSPSEQLRVNNNKIWQGNDPEVTGPQMANATTNGFVPFTPLPVKFTAFKATLQNNTVMLQWSTSEEVNASFYQVERSYDGLSWDAIASVAAVGTTHVTNDYSYADKSNATGTVYYRIKEIDFDGQSMYTAIQSIKTGTTGTDVRIASSQNHILLEFPTEIKGTILIRVVSLSGQVVDQQTISRGCGQVVLNAKEKGDYVISVDNNKDIHTAKQVIL